VPQERVFFEIEGVDSVVVRLNQRWPASHLAFDVYAPPDSAIHGAVLFVHGDAAPERLANMKDHPQFTCWGRIAAASGLVGVTFNRRSTEGGTRLAEAEAEVRTMLDGLREHGGRYGIDANRLGVWVCSAGPPTVVPLLLRERPAFVRCLAVYYGLLDTPDSPTYSAVATLENTLDLNGLAPMLIVRAGQDRPRFNETIDRFVAAALSRNVPVEVLNYPEGEHAFDGRNDTRHTREVIARTLDFLRWHLT